MGSGNCLYWAPEVFELDGEGVAVISGDIAGNEEHLRWAAQNSDYPHPEGLAEPFEWAEEVSNLCPPAAVQKIMGGNMFELIGIKVPA